VAVRLIDGPTAAALAQILPVLLLALMVEVRRTEITQRAGSEHRARVLLGAFFGSFAVVETLLVVSIDGRVLPPRWSDLIAALVIFVLLWFLFAMSMVAPRRKGGRDTSDEGGEPPGGDE
jgi:protein-S-isoprenylcysteine O-methyltransferase Ste14